MYELRRQSLVGRGYDLLRDGEPAGELRRRGFFKERYEFDCGPHRWVSRRHGSGDKPTELADRGSGEVLALWHPGGPVEVAVPEWRPRFELTWGQVGSDRAFMTPEGRGGVTFASQNEGGKVRVEVAGPSAPWPADDPEPSFLVFVALGLSRIVWHIDQQAASSV